jgi:CubicO group peptidase (beta-lactamase class C family)
MGTSERTSDGTESVRAKGEGRRHAGRAEAKAGGYRTGPSELLSEAALDRYIEGVRANWQNVGVAVAVVHNQELIYARGFGVREFAKSAEVDTDTLFQAGSTTKAFTATALGLLVDEGSLCWDDPIIDYVPTFRLRDPWLTDNVTIRDAVSHRTGVLEQPYFVLSVMGADEAVRQLRHIAPEGRFRDSFRYSNLMYAVAGKVVEAASGMTWHEFIRRRLLQPLKMTRSDTSPYHFWEAQHVAPALYGSPAAVCPTLNDARDNNVAMPHWGTENGSVAVLPWQSYDNAAAAGAIVSTAADMAKWINLNLNEGHYERQQLLSKATLREVHSTQNLHGGDSRFLFPLEQTTDGYAMGWWRARYRGHTHLAHGGGIIGFPAYVALLPDRRIGIVILSNGPKVLRHEYMVEGLFHRAIAFWVFDRLLGAPMRDWRKVLSQRARRLEREAERSKAELYRRRLPDRAPSLPLEQYAGVYEDLRGHSGPVQVRAEDGRLSLKFAGEGAYSAYLEHWHQDLFRLCSSPGAADVLGLRFAAFGVDPGGKAISMSAFDATFERLPVRGSHR